MRTFALIGMFVALCASSVSAACGRNGTPNYRDVEAVRYVRTSCFGHCPNYEVLFWGSSLWYVGRSDVARHGTYQATSATPCDRRLLS